MATIPEDTNPYYTNADGEKVLKPGYYCVELKYDEKTLASMALSGRKPEVRTVILHERNDSRLDTNSGLYTWPEHLSLQGCYKIPLTFTKKDEPESIKSLDYIKSIIAKYCNKDGTKSIITDIPIQHKFNDVKHTWEIGCGENTPYAKVPYEIYFRFHISLFLDRRDDKIIVKFEHHTRCEFQIVSRIRRDIVTLLEEQLGEIYYMGTTY